MKHEIFKLKSSIDTRGKLTFLQNGVPLKKIERISWTFDVSSGTERGGHASSDGNELIIALSGSFDVIVREPNKDEETRIHLNKADTGLLVPKRFWRKLSDFSTNALALHIYDYPFNAEGYMRK